MTLYTKAGLEPVTLPFSDIDPDGNTWTNLDNNEDGRVACGWTEAPEVPVVDPWAQEAFWDPTGRQWVVLPKTALALSQELEQARAASLEAAQAYRDARLDAGTSTPFGSVATDADAQRLFGGAATAVLAASAFGFPFSPVPCTLLDGSQVTLDGPSVVQVGLAIVAHVAACRSRYVAIEQALKAATSREGVLAVNIHQGYPA